MSYDPQARTGQRDCAVGGDDEYDGPASFPTHPVSAYCSAGLSRKRRTLLRQLFAHFPLLIA